MSSSPSAGPALHPPLGLLGGSFDPVHNAHLALAREAREALGLRAVRWLPSGKPGHREAARASGEDRLQMLRLALPSGDTLDEAEVRSSEPTYTVNTLRRLRQELGGALPLVFLIGADQLLALDTWREWTSLFDLTHFGVAQRPGYPVSPTSLPPAVAHELTQRAAGAPELAASAAGRIAVFPMQPRDVSSTFIRKAIADGRLPANAVPADVLRYIQSRGLYRAS